MVDSTPAHASLGYRRVEDQEQYDEERVECDIDSDLPECNVAAKRRAHQGHEQHDGKRQGELHPVEVAEGWNWAKMLK